MIAELALGMDAPITIAQKYGFSDKQFIQLQALPWFTEAVYKERERQTSEGVTFQSKSRLMAEELWQDIFKDAKAGNLKPELRIDAAKQLTEIAGLKPKDNRPIGVGGGFVVNITIPQVETNNTREALRTVDIQERPAIDVQFDDVNIPGVKPDMPMSLLMPDVDES